MQSTFRKSTVSLTLATDRQVSRLQQWGYGTFTDIVRIAIDRMFKQEAACCCDLSPSTLSDVTQRVRARWISDITEDEVWSIIVWDAPEAILLKVDSDEIVDWICDLSR
jgi:hypothetical protein